MFKIDESREVDALDLLDWVAEAALKQDCQIELAICGDVCVPLMSYDTGFDLTTEPEPLDPTAIPAWLGRSWRNACRDAGVAEPTDAHDGMCAICEQIPAVARGTATDIEFPRCADLPPALVISFPGDERAMALRIRRLGQMEDAALAWSYATAIVRELREAGTDIETALLHHYRFFPMAGGKLTKVRYLLNYASRFGMEQTNRESVVQMAR